MEVSLGKLKVADILEEEKSVARSFEVLEESFLGGGEGVLRIGLIGR